MNTSEAVLKSLLNAITPNTTPPPPESYVTLKKCAQQLGISTTSLWRYNIPGHELGGRRKFRLSEVEAYLASDALRQRAAKLRRGRKTEAGARHITSSK